MATPLVKWLIAKTANICDECSAPIWPGQTIAVYDDEYVQATVKPHGHLTKCYCEPCGKLLEDSLTTTEAI